MKELFNLDCILRNRPLLAVFSFTLLLTASLSSPSAYALENGANPSEPGLLNDTSYNASATKDERQKRISLVMDYLRNEAPAMIPAVAPALPNAVRAPARWAMQGWSAVRNEFDWGMDGPHGNKLIAALVEPISNLMRAPSPEQDQAIWLTPGYHHKGFLPMHDSLTLGFNTRHRAAGGTLQFDTHPFVGQNWHGAESYWGIETSLALARPATSPNGKPWGKISLRYINGDTALMDHSRGFDMHTELRFDDHVSLHAGVREDIGSGVGNYVMLRWQLASLGE